jgi:hypothetical protein
VEAKGRVERAHGTHQDRLVKKLRLADIRTYEQANRYAEDRYMAEHNQRFAREPAADADFHRKRPSKRELDEVFQLEQERVVSPDWVVGYEGKLLQVERQSRHHAPASSRIIVREDQSGKLTLVYRGYKLRYTEIAQRPAREAHARVAETSPLGARSPQHLFYKPSLDATL